MRFFHLSDLHIGLKLLNRDLLEDQRYILKEICEIASREKPDAVIVAGDIYDKPVPSAEAVDLFNEFVMNLTAAVPDGAVMMISGNHDSAARLDCYRALLSRQNLYMVGKPPMEKGEKIERVTITDEFGPVNFYLLPFVKPTMVKDITGQDGNGNNLSYEAAMRELLAQEKIDLSERNVLVSHQFYLPSGKSADDVDRMDSEITTVGNIDAISAEVLQPFDYAALGHIHKPMKAGSEFYRYCGTPLACSVSEAGQQKGIVSVEMNEKGHVTTSVIPLHPKHEVRIVKGTLEEVLKQACDDYVSVRLTDKVDLNVIDMQDRVRAAFPNLLEITRETVRKADLKTKTSGEKLKDPFELCVDFLGGTVSEEESALLRDVINTVKEA